ncbi:MAG: UDP-2,3-diacylglucosamine diphosphatase [Rhodomicrobium sp.]|nr:UDP-2,3-diacylglucosamine diphosphatase [Rhodomicrobium sp.]
MGPGVDQPAVSNYKAPVRYRALFLSDIHLAARACRSEDLLSFLQSHDAGTIYLVGDVIDFWRLRRGPSWRPSQTEVIKQLLAKAQNGSRIIYIPGNHDDEIRALAGTTLGPVEIRLQAIHDTADGRRFLVIHGDEFDIVIRKALWLAVLGDIAYDIAAAANAVLNRVRRGLGLPYWSLSAFLKYSVKRIVNHAGNFEKRLAGAARKAGAEGVICGHIHHATIQTVEDIQYVNTGDWIESGTAVAEHADGRLEIIRWTDGLRALQWAGSKAPATSATS